MNIIDDIKKYNVLFWNCKGKDSSPNIQNCIYEIVKENEVQIVGLCECLGGLNDILQPLQQVDPNFSFIGESDWLPKGGRIRIFSVLPQKLFTIKRKSNRFLSYVFLDIFDLCFVHLKSLVSTTNESKTMEDLSVIEKIKQEDDREHIFKKKFIVGDFNACPYSNSLVNSRLFNAVRYEEVGKFFFRKDHSKNDVYVNPCWELLGRKKAAVYGTYYYKAADYYNLGTYLFDQVIFNKDLIDYYDDNSLRIINSTSNHSLITTQGKISELYSDHLPIFFSIKG